MRGNVHHGVRVQREVMDENKRDVQIGEYVWVSETAGDNVVGSSEKAQRVGELLCVGNKLGRGRCHFRGSVMCRLILGFFAYSIWSEAGVQLEGFCDGVVFVATPGHRADVGNANVIAAWS